MMFGKAWKVADLCPNSLWSSLNWHDGSALYYVYPAVDATEGGYLGFTHYVIAAYTPRAVDHGKEETTLFVANRIGATYRALGLDTGAEMLAPRERVVGSNNHALAFARIDYELMPHRARRSRQIRDDAGDWHDQRARREAYDDTPIDTDAVPF